MKKSILIFMILSIVVLTNAVELSVLDYYNLMPKELFKSFKYEIENKKGRYYSNSNAEYEFDIIVDIKNKYIEIKDQGTGGGVSGQEFAVFLRSGDDPVLGLSESEFDGAGMDSRIHFYEYKDNKWFNITKKILSEPSIFVFFDAKDDKTKNLLNEMKKYLSLSYVIPRYGTTMKCNLEYSKLGLIADNEDDSKETLNAKKLFDGIKYSTMEFLWDYKKGVFTPGKMIVK